MKTPLVLLTLHVHEKTKAAMRVVCYELNGWLRDLAGPGAF